MMDRQQVDPGMPQGATVSAEERSAGSSWGIICSHESQCVHSNGGGMNVLYLARRAAATLQKMDEGTKNGRDSRMQMTESSTVQSRLADHSRSEKGSQENPLNAAQSPQPTLKPSSSHLQQI